jgi:hypothetical protein
MLEAEQRIIDGLKFQLQPIPPLEAIKLDKRVGTLFLPVISGFKELNMEAEIDLEKIASGVSKALNELSGEDFQKLIIDLFQTTSYLPEGASAEMLTREIINKVFLGKTNSIYKLAFEIMKYNKFSPFVLVGGGNVMSTILGSSKSEKKPKESKESSGKSGNLLET